jgi:hypothetical protein
MSEIRPEFKCCEKLSTKFIISSIHTHTDFKHTASHLGDLEIASRKISEVKDTIMEQERQQLPITFTTLYQSVYICFLLIALRVMCKLYNCLGRVLYEIFTTYRNCNAFAS